MENKRSYPREPVRAKTRLNVDDKWHEGVITNMSTVGMRLYLRMNLEPGMAVRVEIADFGYFNTVVVWCDGVESGLRFEHDPAEIASMLNALAK